MKPAKVMLVLLAFIVGLPTAIILFIVLNMAFWDARVRSLCAADGGVTVFETVDLSAPQYSDLSRDVNGIPLIRSEGRARIEDPFYRSSTHVEEPKWGGVSIARRVSHIVRVADGKTLSTSLSYSRLGGEVFTLGPRSSFSCSDIAGFRLNSEQQTFNLNGE